MQIKPNKSLQPQKFLEYENRPNNRILQAVLKVINKPNLKICDVGGASGVFLNEIITHSKYDINPIILEVNDFYKDKIVNNKIKFKQGSILDKDLEDDLYDIISFRLTLHHIVSNSLKKTILLQQQALKEIFRITKRGGYVIIEEQINQIRIFSWLIYLFSKIANKLKIRSKFFDIENVIIRFLSQKEIFSIISHNKTRYNLKIINNEYDRWVTPIKWRFFLLLNNIGSVFYIIKVQK
jgi:SAM-dependent methyltransferase